MSAMPRWGHSAQAAIRKQLAAYALQLQQVDDGEPIPGSYWGDEEAGLIGATVLIRGDTPLHSLLHEACHAICMGADRRARLHTDAGGDDAEENAVCFLQICLAAQLPDYSAEQCCADMDTWGYSFRLGSARRWFLDDAEDARRWLEQRQLLPPQLIEIVTELRSARC